MAGLVFLGFGDGFAVCEEVSVASFLDVIPGMKVTMVLPGPARSPALPPLSDGEWPDLGIGPAKKLAPGEIF